MSTPTRSLVAVAALSSWAAACGDSDNASDVPVATFEFAVGSSSLDVLWVIDDSPSMAEEQQALVAGIDGLLESTHGIDCRMGVVSTDASRELTLRTGPGNVQERGCMEPPADLAYCASRALDPPYLVVDAAAGPSSTDADVFADEFRCVASTGDCGNSFEMGLLAAREALDPGATGSADGAFVRDAAALLVVFVSNEDDCSNDGAVRLTRDSDCREHADALVGPRSVYDALVAVKGGVADRVAIAGIIGPDGGCDGDAADGARYRELIGYAGYRGYEASICEASLQPALDGVGELIARTVETGRRCLPEAPARCDSDASCPSGAACLYPGGDSVEGFCSDFEVTVEIREPGSTEFVPLDGPGPAGAPVAPGAEFRVDYADDRCAHGVAVAIEPRSLPDAGSAARVSFPGAGSGR